MSLANRYTTKLMPSLTMHTSFMIFVHLQVLLGKDQEFISADEYY